MIHPPNPSFRRQAQGLPARGFQVGPPSIGQIHYGPALERERATAQPSPVVVVSRLVDAPRRIWSYVQPHRRHDTWERAPRADATTA